MKVIGQDQAPESLRKTEELERLKSSHLGYGKQRSQLEERPEKTKEIEEAKRKSGGAL